MGSGQYVVLELAGASLSVGHQAAGALRSAFRFHIPEIPDQAAVFLSPA